MRTLLPLLLVFLAACARTEERAAPPALEKTSALQLNDAHLLLNLELSPSGLRILSSTLVKAPLPRLRVPEDKPWKIAVRDADGRVTYQTSIAPANELRGEFDGPDGRIEGTHVVQPTAVFALRVPAAPGVLTLTVPRASLSPDDPRHHGDGELVDAGSVKLEVAP